MTNTPPATPRDHGRSGLPIGTDGVHAVDAVVDVIDVEPGGPLARFQHEVGDLWWSLGGHCTPLDESELARWLDRLDRHLEGLAAEARSITLANDLRALVAGWAHFDREERAVLCGAIIYLVTIDDAVPDGTPPGDGLDDDDRVVSAAVRVLLRRAP